MTYHARLSPSGAHRWMRCPGSIIATEHLPRTSSKFADEGTAAHQVATWALTEGLDAAAYVGRVIQIVDGAVDEVAVTDDMAVHVQTYVDAVRAQLLCAPDAELLVERDVPIGSFTGEPGATGEADAIVVLRSLRELQLHDLKFGAGTPVHAFENPQLMLYALGALTALDPLLEQFDTVRLFIHQPRRQSQTEWACPLDQLMAFAAAVRQAARSVQLDAPRVPGKDQCKFCQVKATCAERRQDVARTVFDAFDALDTAQATTPPAVKPTGSFDLAHAHSKLDQIEAWCKDVRAHVFAELTAGREVGDLKLVRGKEGNRAWASVTDPDLLLTLAPLGDDAYTPRVLVTPPQAEKAAKAKKLKLDLKAHITRPPGKLTVVAGSDPRPAETNVATPEDFENVDNT